MDIHCQQIPSAFSTLFNIYHNKEGPLRDRHTMIISSIPFKKYNYMTGLGL